MYERNAIVIDRWFSDMFGYGESSNLKNNYKKYCALVEKVEKYQEVTSSEDNMIIEFENAVNEITEVQKSQETLEKRNSKLQESRKNLFNSVDEDSKILQKKFAKIEEELSKNLEEIKKNSERFVVAIADFMEKSENRELIGKERRSVENEYQKVLTDAARNLENINLEVVRDAKVFIKEENHNEMKDAIKEKILKNGEKEKIPFDENVISKAIDMATEIEEEKIGILVSVYEKTVKLLDEIKSDTVKIEKHKKFIKEADSKLTFMNIANEYVILFLDNERISIAGGEKEHKKLMNEACHNVENDIEQIKNLYELIKKETKGKALKKSYKELYIPEYLQDLKEDEKKFEENLSKINMIGAVIYPNYWRIEGMQKIFDTFRNVITENYDVDLSEYEPQQEITEDTEVEDDVVFENDKKFIFNNKKRSKKDDDDEDEFEKDLYADIYDNIEDSENGQDDDDLEDFDIDADDDLDEDFDTDDDLDVDDIDDDDLEDDLDADDLDDEDLEDDFDTDESDDDVEDDFDVDDIDDDDSEDNIDADDFDDDDSEDDFDVDDFDDDDSEDDFDVDDFDDEEDSEDDLGTDDFDDDDLEDDFDIDEEDDSEWNEEKREAKRDRDIDEILGSYNENRNNRK